LLRFVPTNLTDPTGEFPFLAWVVKAGVEALADALMQATVNYFFDPNINTAAEAFDSIDPLQVGVAFVTGLLPGGNVIQSVAGALGDVLLNYLDALENCQEYTPEQAIDDFAKSFVIELLVSDAFDLIRKYGLPVIVTGLRKHGYDDLAERLLRKGDDLTDNGSPRDKDGPDGPSCSFRIDTPVMTDEGFVFIGELQAGDYVLAFNEATGEIGYYPILAVWAHEDSVIQYLTIDGEQIVTTPNHPFQTGTDEWLPAGELQVGDTIHTAQEGTGIVQATTFVYQPQPMYNLTVAAAHTYFVGAGQWLVHNTCFKSFTARNFRENLSRLTGLRPGTAFEAHHALPQKFRRNFNAAGINIHDPIYGSWVDKTAHRGWSRAYNQNWDEFFEKNASPSSQQVLSFARQLATRYGFNVNFP
jgi:hypothetical protein